MAESSGAKTAPAASPEPRIVGMADQGGSWLIHRWRPKQYGSYLSVCGLVASPGVMREEPAGVKRCRRCFKPGPKGSGTGES